MVHRKEADRAINLVLIMVFLILVISGFLSLIKIPMFRAPPPSFHEFYGTIKCANDASLQGKLLNITVQNNTFYSAYYTISENFYNNITQLGSPGDYINFSINKIEIASSIYTPFTYEQKDISINDLGLCPPPNVSPGSGSESGSGSGSGSGDIGDSFFSSSNKTQTITINISVEPKGAYIYLNNTFIGFSPVSIKIQKGQYILKVIKEGYQQIYKSLDLQNDLILNLSLEEIKEIQNPQPPTTPNITYYKQKNWIIITGSVIIAVIVLFISFTIFYIKKHRNQ